MILCVIQRDRENFEKLILCSQFSCRDLPAELVNAMIVSRLGSEKTWEWNTFSPSKLFVWIKILERLSLRNVSISRSILLVVKSRKYKKTNRLSNQRISFRFCGDNGETMWLSETSSRKIHEIESERNPRGWKNMRRTLLHTVPRPPITFSVIQF